MSKWSQHACRIYFCLAGRHKPFEWRLSNKTASMRGILVHMNELRDSLVAKKHPLPTRDFGAVILALESSPWFWDEAHTDPVSSDYVFDGTGPDDDGNYDYTVYVASGEIKDASPSLTDKRLAELEVAVSRLTTEVAEYARRISLLAAQLGGEPPRPVAGPAKSFAERVLDCVTANESVAATFRAVKDVIASYPEDPLVPKISGVLDGPLNAPGKMVALALLCKTPE